MLLIALGTSAMVAAMAGCQRGLAGVDRETQKLLEDRSSVVDGGSLTPSRTYGGPDDYYRSGQAAKEVPTVNPPAEDLDYTPAVTEVDPEAEAAALAAKLSEYSERELAPSPDTLKLDIEGAWRLAQVSGREFITAEEDYILAAIRLLQERHLWGPRFFNDTTASIAGQGDDGDFDSAVRVINDLRVTQRLPYGGEVEAGWVWDATEQLRKQATGRYTQSSELLFSGSIPLLRGAGLVAQESLIQAERNLIYQARTFEDFRRRFLVQIASDYFDLLQSGASIRTQEERLKALRFVEEATAARVDAGRLAEYQKNIAVNQRLSAEASLAGQRESYLLALDRFKIRLGLSVDARVEIEPLTKAIEPPETDLEEATARAMEFRLDLQNQRDQLDDTRRAVANAKNQILPDLNAQASLGIPTDPDVQRGGVAFDPDDLSYAAGITFGLPLDRENERLALRAAIIGMERAQREYDRFRDQVALAVREAARNIDLARFQLRLADQQVEISSRRLEELQIKAAEVDTQTQVDAANDLASARDSRDQARTALRNAVLNYLLVSGQLRVARDGTFEPLPGMREVPVVPAENEIPPGPGEDAAQPPAE